MCHRLAGNGGAANEKQINKSRYSPVHGTARAMSPWKKTFYASWVAQVFSITGFSFVLPFIPLYVRSLGIEDDADVARWAGIIGAGAGLTMTVFAPLWGELADRYGRKLMVLRAMFSGAVVLGLMGFARNVGDLLILRLLQGALTGTVTASVALVSSVTPSERSGYALGMMQAAVFGGASLGPLIGGAMADRLGFRAAFLVAALVLVAGGFLVAFGVTEKPRPSATSSEWERGSFAKVFAAAGFMVAVFALFQIHFANTTVAPVFPLFVERLRGTRADTATVTGAIFSVAGIVAALSAGVMGRFGDAWGHKRLLVICTLVAGMISLPQAFSRNVVELFVLRVLFGLVVAGIMPSANALIRAITLENNLGRAYGVTSSASCLGMTLGPLAGGYLAANMGLRAPFVLTGAVLIVTSFLVAWRGRNRRYAQTDAERPCRNRL